MNADPQISAGRGSNFTIVLLRCPLVLGPPAFDHSDSLSPSELCFCNQFTGLGVQFQLSDGS